MTYYLIYRTTNTLTNEWYAGAHKTEDKNDTYPGSGDRIKNSINKYGRENFIREILEEFANEDDMYLKEDDYIDLADPLCLNISPGGRGNSFRHINEIFTEEQRKSRAQKSAKTRKEKYTPEQRKEWSNNARNNMKTDKPFLGKIHTEETKDKISKSNKISVLGVKNGSFGSKWISHKEISKSIKVKLDLAVEFLEQGWEFGRLF